jgi:hypothetical protein
MTFTSKILVATAAFCLCLAATAAASQKAGSMMPATVGSSMGHMDQAMMHSKAHHPGNASMHNMPATVTSVDTGSSIVEVTSGGMSLRVHFPPASVAKRKAGDKIILHLGYSVSQ